MSGTQMTRLKLTDIYFLKNILKIQKSYIIVIHNDLMI